MEEHLLLTSLMDHLIIISPWNLKARVIVFSRTQIVHRSSLKRSQRMAYKIPVDGVTTLKIRDWGYKRTMIFILRAMCMSCLTETVFQQQGNLFPLFILTKEPSL